ncbi:MAG: GntR family transcriptional regulator [Pseudomonadota bacterium]
MTSTNSKGLSNTKRAVVELRRMILSGELAAGTDHLESELAEQLKMSRTPIREAALTLESAGLLELRPRKGVRILPISPQDMREVYDVVTELESLAAERAAETGYTLDELHALKTAISDMDTAIDEDDLEAWARADDAFHAELVRLSGNQRIASIVGMVSDQIQRAKAATLYIRPIPTKSNEDHRVVYAAICAGDAKTARERHRAHRRQAKTLLVALLEKHRLLRL